MDNLIVIVASLIFMSIAHVSCEHALKSYESECQKNIAKDKNVEIRWTQNGPVVFNNESFDVAIELFYPGICRKGRCHNINPIQFDTIKSKESKTLRYSQDTKRPCLNFSDAKKLYIYKDNKKYGLINVKDLSKE